MKRPPSGGLLRFGAAVIASGAKQSIAPRGQDGLLPPSLISYGGQVVATAPRNDEDATPRSRGAFFARVMLRSSPSKTRGRRERRMLSRTRGSHAEKNATGTPEHRHSLRNGWRLIRALLGVPCLLASVASGTHPRLDPSVGGPGPHDFASTPHPALVSRKATRPSLPASNVRDGRDAPPDGGGMRAANHYFPKNGSGIFFAGGLDIDSDKTNKLICPSCRSCNRSSVPGAVPFLLPLLWEKDEITTCTAPRPSPHSCA
jgi:hypothetical protein